MMAWTDRMGLVMLVGDHGVYNSIATKHK